MFNGALSGVDFSIYKSFVSLIFTEPRWWNMREDSDQWMRIQTDGIIWVAHYFLNFIFSLFSPSSANQLQFPHSLHFQEITFCGIYEIISDSEDTTCGSTSSSLTSHAFRMISSKCLWIKNDKMILIQQQLKSRSYQYGFTSC